MIRPAASLLLATGLLTSASAAARAQWATPVAVAPTVPDMPALPRQQPERETRGHPRPGLVAAIATAVGVGGGVAGYLAAEHRCARATYECWDHFIYVPSGYVLGVALGGGMAGTAEGCRTGILRSTGGALLGFAAGVATLHILDPASIVVLPVAPVVGATWLVTRCRTSARADRNQ